MVRKEYKKTKHKNKKTNLEVIGPLEWNEKGERSEVRKEFLRTSNES